MNHAGQAGRAEFPRAGETPFPEAVETTSGKEETPVYDGSFCRVFTIAPITPTPSKAIAPTAIQVPLNPNKLAPYARAPTSRAMPTMYTTKFVMRNTAARLLPKTGVRVD